MIDKKKMVFTLGKRKTAIAKTTLKSGNGRVTVNNIPAAILEPETFRVKVFEALLLAGDKASEVDISVNVHGGGLVGRAEAVRTSIARAFINWTKSKDLKKKYINYDRTMLAGDSRRTEPKKFGGPGARRRKQKSYR
jgi:small subunit ribosomal protein S9